MGDDEAEEVITGLVARSVMVWQQRRWEGVSGMTGKGGGEKWERGRKEGQRVMTACVGEDGDVGGNARRKRENRWERELGRRKEGRKREKM